jgi:2-(1,2-epoxy-1,2-dihydrophenyl)acetyl-CoA isomerase
VGLSGDFGGTWTLPRIVGPAKARELYLLADVFMADEAKNINLVSDVFPDRDSMMLHVNTIAKKLTLRAPTALARIKANLNDADRVSFPEALNNEAERMARMGYSPENRIAASAFVDKTDPDFSKVLKKRAPWELSSL